jgi:UDP-galactopyranose mutase
MFDYLVVGAGFAGATIAERLASQAGKTVLICDRRPHIGGNAFDHYDEAGILVHKYGPHIFHTNSREVYEYLSNFTEWRPYQHRVLASVDGQLVPIPRSTSTPSIGSTARTSPRWSSKASSVRSRSRSSTCARPST